MMKKYIFIITIFLPFTVFIFSFKMYRQGKTNQASAIITSQKFHKPVRDKQFFAATTEIIPIDTAFVSKDSLHIITRKVSGCDAENFKLVWSGNMVKSSPPQTAVRLFKVADIECSEKHKFHLVYNITPLKLKQDSIANKVTTVHLGGWKEPLKYEFDSLPGRQHKN